MSTLKPGHPRFLGALQTATTVLWNEVSAKDKDDYIHSAKEWSENKPPKNIQARYALAITLA